MNKPVASMRRDATALNLPKLPYSFCKRHNVIVTTDNGLNAYHTPDLTLATMQEVQRFYQSLPVYHPVDQEEFARMLEATYQSGTVETARIILNAEASDLSQAVQDASGLQDIMEEESEAPIVQLINALLMDAIKKGASDIHIEPAEEGLVFRFRVDGILQTVAMVKRGLGRPVISRIKVMAALDIAEKRIPQDGRISLRLGYKDIDIRVSTLPSNDGERVVMRLLDKRSGIIAFDQLGLVPDIAQKMQQLVHQPHGIVLVVGPTGSGKTTTLYACLQTLINGERNIMTVEDPVEYRVAGISQTQVNHQIGMSFAKSLRAILRQDPDVIMLGEIRDKETAEIAIQASITGHLVLSTLHTNSAIEAINRMKDIGIAPYQIASAFRGVMAQRLVRRLCLECREPYEATVQEKILLRAAPNDYVVLHSPKGCVTCSGIGFRSRIAVCELFVIDEVTANMIAREASIQEIQNHRHYTTLHEDGINRVLAGDTSLQELLRVTGGI